MAVRRFNARPTADRSTANPYSFSTENELKFYLCDTFAELPTLMNVGDQAYVISNNTFWIASTTTVWSAMGPSSGSALTVREEDGSPIDTAVSILRFPNGSLTVNAAGDISVAFSTAAAPPDADYLVGTANAGLSAEIVVGTTPGGELGGSWASPTVDSVHSGSAHHNPLTIGADAEHSLAAQVLSGVDASTTQKGHAKFDSTNPNPIGTVAPGVSGILADRAHIHATGAGTPTTIAPGDAAAIGAGPAAAMTNHVHGAPATWPATAATAGHDVHDEVSAALTRRADIHFMGKGLFAQDNGGRTEIIAGTQYDAIVDSNDTNATGKGNVYTTLQAAITAGHVSIWVRACTDSADITITTEAVNRITGADVQTTTIPVNLTISKANVLIEQCQFSGKMLTLNSSGIIAFACLFTGSPTAGTAQVNNGAGWAAGDTSLAFDTGMNGGLATRGYGKVDNEVFAWPAGGASSSGTLALTSATGRGTQETLATTHADNAVITDMNNGNLVIKGADCEVTACAFVVCSNANLPALWIYAAAFRTKVTASRFLANSSWSCIATAADGTNLNGPQGTQIIGNKFDSNTTTSNIFEHFGKDTIQTADGFRGLQMNGNLFRQFDTGCIRGLIAASNISGNVFEGVTRQTQTALINKVGGITNADNTIDYDTASAAFPGKGLIEIEGEEIWYSAKSATQFLGCRRGQNGTTAAAHADNATINNRSQRAFTWLGSTNSTDNTLATIVSGNTIQNTYYVSLVSYTGGTTQFPTTMFATNVVSLCNRWSGELGCLWVGNALKSSSLTIDFRSKTGQVFLGNLFSATFANIPTDLHIAAVGSAIPAGALTRDVFATGQNQQFGFTRGDASAITVPMKNKTGANSVAKAVVIADAANANSYTTIAAANSAAICGVSMTGGIADGSDVDIAVAGVVVVTCTGTVNVGDDICTSATAGVAQTNAAWTKGTRLGKARTAGVFGAGTGDITVALMLS